MTDPGTTEARRAAEQAARSSYGRLLALLAARTRDIAAAEDALAEAFAAALRSWPGSGVPDNPDAWLMTTARNHLSNAARHRAVADATVADLLLLADEAAPEHGAWPDERLKLLFVCAHPAIDERARTPLMLQAVLGLDAAQIAAAFLVAPATMGQRLVRAKARIKGTGMRFELPTAEDMPARLADVHEAIYAAYGTSWDAVPGADGAPPDLAGEALFLARLLVALLPDEPESQGPLALMLYCESRRAARRGAGGGFVPLAEQDAWRWSRELIVEAEGLLTAASRRGVFGRFQCEAAIQSVHAQRPLTGRTNHDALATLYRLLVAHCPTVGARVGQAAARLDAAEVSEAMQLLDGLHGAPEVAAYQPYWVTRSRTLRAAGRHDEARGALQTAVGLTHDPALRAYLVETAGDGEGARDSR
jgi:RNA polymerase sigma-70 factor (ECF subfamily)